MIVVSTQRDAWIDIVLGRADDLRRKGVLSIGVDGCTATFVPGPPAEPGNDRDGDEDPEWKEPLNPWEDPNSYPSGIVPTLDVDKLEGGR